MKLLLTPSFIMGFLYGLKMTDRVMSPEENRSPFKRTTLKIFLYFFMIGAIFSSITFALHGGMRVPIKSIFDYGIIQWVTEYVSANGGLTFLIVSSITIMAAATKRIIGMAGIFSKFFSFVGTFVFFSMILLSMSNSEATPLQIYLYACYEAGIVGGIFFQMNRITSRSSIWEEFSNSY